MAYRDPGVVAGDVGGHQRHPRHRHAPPPGTTRCHETSGSSCGGSPPLGGLDPTRPFDDRVRDLLLAALYAAPSTLALIPFQDALGTRERINVPGTVDAANWTYRMP